MEILDSHISHPLEREFESWVIRGIEEYFKAIHKEVQVIAVSPLQEHKYPADDCFKYEGKLVGLQFKRPYLALRNTNKKDYSRLKWDINRAQLGKIKSIDWIYYALPTFINRMWKEEALSHCIFWRPGKGVPESQTAWYNNPNANNNPYKSIINSESVYFWGEFIQEIMSCEIGKVVKDSSDVTQYLKDIKSYTQENDKKNSVIYLLYMSVPIIGYN